jgi:hypothetical protein
MEQPQKPILNSLINLSIITESELEVVGIWEIELCLVNLCLFSLQSTQWIVYQKCL